MKKLIILLMLFCSSLAYGQKIQKISNWVVYNAIGADSMSLVPKVMYVRKNDSSYAQLALVGGQLKGFDKAISNSWFDIVPVTVTAHVDTLYKDGLHLNYKIGSNTYQLIDAFKNLETSNMLLPGNRIIDLNTSALVFSDGLTHYDFDGSLMTLYIADLDGNSAEVQLTSTNVNISATSPDDNATFGFGANLITAGINGNDLSITQDSITAEQHVRAKTFQTETAKTKVLDGGVVVQDAGDVTVSYLLGKNVGGYVYDVFSSNPADVTPIATGGSIFANSLDSLRPSWMNSSGVSKSFLLQGDVSGSSTDTTSLSNRINLKLNISDTAAMLAAYLRKIDTAAMLLGYQKRCHLQTLTDAGTVTWNYATSCEALVTITANRTLNITNLPSNYVSYGTLTVIQDATGSRTLALPATSKVTNGGAGVIALSTTGNARDVISFRYLPTLGIFEWTYGRNFN